jgi:hypothetical protein
VWSRSGPPAPRCRGPSAIAPVVAGKPRGVGDGRSRDAEPGELQRRQRLAEHRPAERRPGERRGEAEQGRRGRRQLANAVEPQHEGHCGGGQAQVGERDEVGGGRGRRRALHQGGERQEEDATQQQLPPGGRDAVRGYREAFGEHYPGSE